MCQRIGKHAAQFNREHAVRAREFLQLKKPRKAAKKKGDVLLTSARLRMCFPKGGGCTVPARTLARQFRCSHPTVLTTQAAVAEKILQQQSAALSLQVTAYAQGLPSLAVIEKMKWDETSQALVIPDQPTSKKRARDGARAPMPRRSQKLGARGSRRPKLTPSEDSTSSRGGRQVLVQRHWVRWVRPTTDAIMPLVVSPLALQRASAECILAGMSRTVDARERQLKQAVATSQRLVLVRECDAAPSNIRVLNQMMADAPLAAIMFVVLCNVHQLYLVTGALLRCFGEGRLELINHLYCSALLLRGPNSFTAYIRAIEAAVAQKAIVVKRPPDASWRATALQALESFGWAEGDREVDEFLGTFNGNWSEEWRVPHYCTCSPPCRRSDVVRRMVSLLVSFLASCRPHLPQPSRWLKIYESLQFFGPAFALHGVGRQAMATAFGHQERQVQERLRPGAASPATGPQLVD